VVKLREQRDDAIQRAVTAEQKLAEIRTLFGEQSNSSLDEIQTILETP
jgi:hypothetical protein